MFNCSEYIMSKMWPLRVLKIKASTVFSCDICVFLESRKIRTRWRQKSTPYTFLTCKTSKRQILTEITIHRCVSYLCSQPIHHLRGTASIHQDIPVPAGPGPPKVSGLEVYRSTGMHANPSGSHTLWLLNITFGPYGWIQPKDGSS